MKPEFPAGKVLLTQKGVVQPPMPARRQRYDFFSSPSWGMQASGTSRVACPGNHGSLRLNKVRPGRTLFRAPFSLLDITDIGVDETAGLLYPASSNNAV